jgi:hypothetical protein
MLLVSSFWPLVFDYQKRDVDRDIMEKQKLSNSNFIYDANIHLLIYSDG